MKTATAEKLVQGEESNIATKLTIVDSPDSPYRIAIRAYEKIKKDLDKVPIIYLNEYDYRRDQNGFPLIIGIDKRSRQEYLRDTPPILY